MPVKDIVPDAEGVPLLTILNTLSFDTVANFAVSFPAVSNRIISSSLLSSTCIFVSPSVSCIPPTPERVAKLSAPLPSVFNI